MAFQSDYKLIILVLLLVLEQLVAKPLVPYYFVFGDSLNDNGTSGDTFIPVDYSPYGIDFPDRPTGRYSNGRTFVDVVEQFLGFDDFIPPYANASGKDILQGVNYASAGAGILDITGKRLGKIATFTDQLRHHQYIVSEIVKILGDKNSAASHLRKCLYYIDIGNNDFAYLFGGSKITRQYTPKLYANLLIETYSQKIKDLYKYGARKMILAGAGLVGPTPFASERNIPEFHIDSFNSVIRIYNGEHRSLVGYLNANFPDAKFTHLDTYATSQDLLDNASRYGFKVTTIACCGIGWKRGPLTCQPNEIPCKNRNEYLFWDPFHSTEAANIVIAGKLFSDEAGLFTYPFTIPQLAWL